MMAEEQVFFTSGAPRLEGLLHSAPGERGVVITHPHSLYGGSMHNNVVEAMVLAYRGAGFTTLRFNFRGVGRSQVEYDQGQGEREDVVSALDYLAKEGKTAIDLAGYSFGAWVNALAAPLEDKVRHMAMVSPPVAFLDFREISRIPRLRFVIAGGRDDFAPPREIEVLLPAWNSAARLEIIDGADHFYSGYTDRIESLLSAYLQSDHGKIHS